MRERLHGFVSWFLWHFLLKVWLYVNVYLENTCQSKNDDNKVEKNEDSLHCREEDKFLIFLLNTVAGLSTAISQKKIKNPLNHK